MDTSVKQFYWGSFKDFTMCQEIFTQVFGEQYLNYSCPSLSASQVEAIRATPDNKIIASLSKIQIKNKLQEIDVELQILRRNDEIYKTLQNNYNTKKQVYINSVYSGLNTEKEKSKEENKDEELLSNLKKKNLLNNYSTILELEDEEEKSFILDNNLYFYHFESSPLYYKANEPSKERITRTEVKKLCADKKFLEKMYNQDASISNFSDAESKKYPFKIKKHFHVYMWCYMNLYSTGAIAETEVNQMFYPLFEDHDDIKKFLFRYDDDGYSIDLKGYFESHTKTHYFYFTKLYFMLTLTNSVCELDSFGSKLDCADEIKFNTVLRNIHYNILHDKDRIQGEIEDIEDLQFNFSSAMFKHIEYSNRNDLYSPSVRHDQHYLNLIKFHVQYAQHQYHRLKGLTYLSSPIVADDLLTKVFTPQELYFNHMNKYYDPEEETKHFQLEYYSSMWSDYMSLEISEMKEIQTIGFSKTHPGWFANNWQFKALYNISFLKNLTYTEPYPWSYNEDYKNLYYYSKGAYVNRKQYYYNYEPSMQTYFQIQELHWFNELQIQGQGQGQDQNAIQFSNNLPLSYQHRYILTRPLKKHRKCDLTKKPYNCYNSNYLFSAEINKYPLHTAPNDQISKYTYISEYSPLIRLKLLNYIAHKYEDKYEKIKPFFDYARFNRDEIEKYVKNLDDKDVNQIVDKQEPFYHLTYIYYAAMLFDAKLFNNMDLNREVPIAFDYRNYCESNLLFQQAIDSSCSLETLSLRLFDFHQKFDVYKNFLVQNHDAKLKEKLNDYFNELIKNGVEMVANYTFYDVLNAYRSYMDIKKYFFAVNFVGYEVENACKNIMEPVSIKTYPDILKADCVVQSKGIQDNVYELDKLYYSTLYGYVYDSYKKVVQNYNEPFQTIWTKDLRIKENDLMCKVLDWNSTLYNTNDYDGMSWTRSKVAGLKYLIPQMECILSRILEYQVKFVTYVNDIKQ